MRLHATVKGRVQGVGYRFFVRAWGRELGLDGWVRNLEDGRVEVDAYGPEEALADLERVLREGPQGARVDSVSVRRGEGAGDGTGFEVRHF